MMFFDERFPEDISFGARGGPRFSTEVNRTVGGQRFVNRNWLLPLQHYDVSHGIKVPADFERIRAFFYNVYGQFDAFRYKDWTDFECNAVKLGSLAPLDAPIWQLQRDYVRGVRTFHRPIYKPRPGKVIVTRHRAGATSTPSSSVDYATGQVTMTGHVSGDTYTWVGEFDVPVAFTSDVLEAQVVNRNPQKGLLVEWPAITLDEIRL